jgi:glucokinase
MFFKSKHYLVADVGGTKSALAVIDDKYNILLKKIYPSSEITNFTDIIKNFLSECKQYHINTASIAVAGTPNSDRTFVKLTNLEWAVDAHEIIKHTKIKYITLLNDFEAIGFSIDILKNTQYVELTNNGSNMNGNIVIIGAGTGLGVSILPYSSDRHIPLASEGGHVDLSIITNDPIDIKFQTFMLKKKLYRDAEDVISGRGIVNIYDFLKTQKVKHNLNVKKIISKARFEDKPALITKYALEDKDTLCLRVIELFIKYYARASRNLVLTTLSTELVLAGGIAPKILSVLQDVFVEEFVQHNIESMRKILERVTVIVLIETDTSLYGALNALNYSV